MEFVIQNSDINFLTWSPTLAELPHDWWSDFLPFRPDITGVLLHSHSSSTSFHRVILVLATCVTCAVFGSPHKMGIRFGGVRSSNSRPIYICLNPPRVSNFRPPGLFLVVEGQTFHTQLFIPCIYVIYMCMYIYIHIAELQISIHPNHKLFHDLYPKKFGFRPLGYIHTVRY